MVRHLDNTYPKMNANHHHIELDDSVHEIVSGWRVIVHLYLHLYYLLNLDET